MVIRGLLIDFGGVLTTSLGETFDAFAEREGIDRDRFHSFLREAYLDEDPDSLVFLVETGEMPVEEFERRLAAALSEGLHRPVPAEGLVARMLEGVAIDERMVNLVWRARRSGHRTGLLSNSWGLDYYPQELLDELFDAVVISGAVGMRKPGVDIFHHAAGELGVPVRECLFVDDAEPNVAAARLVGMQAYLHEDTERSVKELEELLGLAPDGSGISD